MCKQLKDVQPEKDVLANHNAISPLEFQPQVVNASVVANANATSVVSRPLGLPFQHMPSIAESQLILAITNPKDASGSSYTALNLVLNMDDVKSLSNVLNAFITENSNGRVSNSLNVLQSSQLTTGLPSRLSTTEKVYSTWRLTIPAFSSPTARPIGISGASSNLTAPAQPPANPYTRPQIAPRQWSPTFYVSRPLPPLSQTDNRFFVGPRLWSPASNVTVARPITSFVASNSWQLSRLFSPTPIVPAPTKPIVPNQTLTNQIAPVPTHPIVPAPIKPIVPNQTLTNPIAPVPTHPIAPAPTKPIVPNQTLTSQIPPPIILPNWADPCAIAVLARKSAQAKFDVEARYSVKPAFLKVLRAVEGVNQTQVVFPYREVMNTFCTI